MTYLLDTCLISELVAKQPNQKVLDWLDAQSPETLYLSVITMGEIAKGISKLTPSRRKEELDIWLKQTLPNRFAGRIIDIKPCCYGVNYLENLKSKGDHCR
jgi:predicted nucleic acid-binding protein